MRTFIYTLRLLPFYQNESNWTEETTQIVSEHFQYLQALQQQGIVILAGKTDYSVENLLNFGIVIFYAKEEEEAKNLMENDPAVKKEVMAAVLHPFSLALLINT
jgi:uncharacterized protein YciI